MSVDLHKWKKQLKKGGSLHLTNSSNIEYQNKHLVKSFFFTGILIKYHIPCLKLSYFQRDNFFVKVGFSFTGL